MKVRDVLALPWDYPDKKEHVVVWQRVYMQYKAHTIGDILGYRLDI